MSFNDDDLAHLLDIYEYAVEVSKLTKKREYYYFEKTKWKRLALERALEIIGEASNKLSTKTKETLNHIPWREIIGLRNRLAHEYGEIKIVVLWEISQKHIPILIKQLKQIEELKPFIKNKG